jgi:hypothetical protein
MRDITFALIREGTSDNGLVPHIRSLLIEAGATSVMGATRDYTGTTLQKLQRVVAEQNSVDIIFVHRDADDRNPESRHLEIMTAAKSLAWSGRVVPVVPVQELEAWLLVDEAAIRFVVGKPNGKVPLALPAVGAIENRAKPKEVLRAACVDASETSGARRKKEFRRYAQRRATLLERLDPNGPVVNLTSWQRFVGDLNSVAGSIFSSRGV